MEPGTDGSDANVATTSAGDPQAGAASMTYANLETLSRLNTDDLTSILSNHHQHHHHHRHEDDEENGAHYADASGEPEAEETATYIVPGSTEAYHQGTYVVTAAGSADDQVNNGNDPAGLDDQSTTDNEASGLSVHSYCKPSNGQEAAEARPATEVVATNRAASVGTSAELIDLKAGFAGSTTRRVLLIDDGHGDLEMAKSDVEFLLRGDAAGIVLREGKRSEVWSRFGKVTFQGRKVKGYVACIYCRQVYAFGDAHSTGTSTLKKHRCMAQSIVTTSPVGQPDRLMPSPAPPTNEPAYVNFPSPSVIVSIATAVRPGSDEVQLTSTLAPSVMTSSSITTRYLAPNERDDLVRQAGVVLGSGGVNANCFASLAKMLVELGAKHGAGLADDMNIIFNSPSFETMLPSIAQEYRVHFTEEIRTSSGIALILDVLLREESVELTLGVSYCIVDHGPAGSKPFTRHFPLRRALLDRDSQTPVRIGQWIQRTLKEERIDHVRRSVVCNSLDVIQKSLAGQMGVPCARQLIDLVLASAHSALSDERTDWQSFRDAVQQVSNVVQLMGWESQLAKSVHPSKSNGIEWIELVVALSSQVNELHKLFAVHQEHSSTWNQLDRNALNHLSVFYNGVISLINKLTTCESPTICHVLLVRSHFVALCTPRSHVDSPLLSAVKHAALTSVSKCWPLDLVHRLACVLHPAFKHLRRLDVSDRERMEAYSMIRNLLRQYEMQPEQHLQPSRDLKRKSVRNSEQTSKRPRLSNSTPAPIAPTNETGVFEFSDLADFSFSCSSNAGQTANGLIPEQRDELDLYLEEKVIQQDLNELANVLVYWKHRQSVFPALSQLAFWLLALPATVVVGSGLSHAAAKSDAVLNRQLFQVVSSSNGVASNVPNGPMDA